MMNKKRRIIIIVVIVVIAAIFTKQMVHYFSLKSEARGLIEKEIVLNIDNSIDVVGLLDSYGVPYSESVNKSFLNYISESLANQGKLSSSLDLYNLYINKTWHLNGLYSNDVTIGELVEMQNFSIDFVRHKYEDMIKDDISYECDNEQKDISIYEYTRALEHPIILYSCAANDLFYYYGFSLENLNLKKCVELVLKFKASKDELGKHIESNIETLLECNPKSQIFVMGLYLPSDNFLIQCIGSPVIEKINQEIQAVCDNYENVYYVDVSCVSFAVLPGDFHPNGDGQYVIANKLADSINENYKTINDLVIYDKNESDSAEVSKGDYSGYIDAIYTRIIEEGLPLNDYVEAATAIEWALDQCEIEDIGYQELEEIRDELVERFDDKAAIISRGIEINIIERKILGDEKESNYSSHPDTVKNDKIGLMDYY